MNSRHFVNDYTLQAFIDNELGPAERHQVSEYIKSNEDVNNRYQQILAQKRLLQQWWQRKMRQSC
ncbi:MAG: hypothetical protein LRZ85_02435 [Alphaproteobacteria bacterium]|nr:hypothetical protein [Alphaproteobacteria bacterium]